MSVKKSKIVWFFIIVHVTYSERRIQEGIDVKAEKRYVVYFVKAPLSKAGYDYWLCGGALVTTDFVVTSAACIKDVDYLYVIAGYNKYIVDDEIETDPCTSKKKKKVVYTCYPEGYELKYDRLDKWAFIDIGIAKVESPYDFEDQSFKTVCSYIPGVIAIGYDAKHQEPKNDAVVFGWGHTTEWRQKEDNKNHNSKHLKYAPVTIIDKTECKEQYQEYGEMIHIIDTYMICTLGGGQINDFGNQIESTNGGSVFFNGCPKRKSWATNSEDQKEDCEEYDETRREINESISSVTVKRNINNLNKTRAETNRTNKSSRPNGTTLTRITTSTNKPASVKGSSLTDRTVSLKKPLMSNNTGVFNETVRTARRYGICQNDHGGPLVTWVGAHEVLIGVASVFKVADDFKCIGPFLYTSTLSNGAFLDCILSRSKFDVHERTGSLNNIHMRSFCTKSQNGEKHPTMERHISWLLHPAGPADHEKHLKKPEQKQPDAKERERPEKFVNENEGSANLTDTNNPQVERFSLNNKQYVPNRFQINSGQNVPNIDENKTPNKNYEATFQQGPVAPSMITHTVNNAPVSNNKPAQESMKRFELSDKNEQKNEPAPHETARESIPASNYRSHDWPTNKNKAPKNIGRSQNNGPEVLLRPLVPFHIYLKSKV